MSRPLLAAFRRRRVRGLPGLGAAVAITVAALMLAAPAIAAPVVRQAAGADADAIAPARDQFRADLGGGPSAGANGSFGGVRREINWDGTPAGFSEPNPLPGGFFNSNSPRGVVFSTPGSGFMVSAEGLSPTRFSSLRPEYGFIFGAFSPEKLFTPLGSTVTEVSFFVPGTTTRADTRGFGAVFADVDLAGSARLELFDPQGAPLGSFAVPPAGNINKGLSFLGVTFNAGERIGRVRITSGAGALSDQGPSPLDVTQGDANPDIVTLDDFVYGEPSATPAPPPGGEPSNEFSFGKAKRNKKKGTAKLTVKVPGPGELELAKSKKVKPKAKRAEEAGTVKLPIKPKRKARKKLAKKGKARVKAEVTFTPDGAEAATESKRVKLVKR